MALIERLKGRSPSAARTVDGPDRKKPREADATHDTAYHELKSRVHNKLFDHLDLSRLNKVSEAQVTEDVALATKLVLDGEKVLLTLEDRERLVREIQHEVFGLGPLEPLLQDPTVDDILVNGFEKIFVERHGKIEKTVARFKDDTHLMRVVDKIVSGVGRRVDESNPMVDARLADGSRVNVIIPPLALDGPTMSIRRFAGDPFKAGDLVQVGTLTEELVELLEAIVRSRLNVLISGGTGAGKTTLLNVLSSFIPSTERIVTIEDAAELQLKQEHVVRLETRPANIEGRLEVNQRDLVINSLRMRPDRIIVGEVRGREALDMLQAMNTGHDGSLTTIHSNSPRDALTRIETMVAMTGLELPQKAVRQQVGAALDVVIQLSRLSDGTRRLMSLQEITGMEGEVIVMQEIFRFDQRGIDKDGNVIGDIVPTGIRPNFAEKLRLAGVELAAELFERRSGAPMSNPVLIVLVFLSTVLALEGIYLIVVDRRRSGKAQVQRRLQMLSGRITAASLGGETSILRSLQSGRRSLADQVLGLLPNRDSLDLMLYRAGMPMSPQRFLTSCAALAGIGWVIATLQLNDVRFGAVGLLLGLLPRIYVGGIARRRMREFETQFPEALDLLTRALRAGHSLSTGFQLVGDEMPEPISLEFAVVAEEIKFGLDVRSALQNLAHRVENRDIPFFITAVLIQRETGGNLAELLDNLGRILRERGQFYGKVQAITSQGRMAANILALWPPITVGLVSLTGSDYLDPLWTTPRGHAAIIASGIGIILGWFLARRLATVKV